MLLLCMVGFIEYDEIDLLNAQEPMHESMVQYVSCSNYDHVLLIVLLPDVSRPQLWAHRTAYTFYPVIQVAF